MKIIQIIIFFIALSSFSKAENYYVYKMYPKQDKCQLIYEQIGTGDIYSFENLEYLEIIVHGDQRSIKNGDSFNFLFSYLEKDFEKHNLNYLIDDKVDRKRANRIKSLFKPKDFGRNVTKYKLISEDSLLDDVKLSITYNNQSPQVQIHGDQSNSVSKELIKNEKKILNTTQYIQAEITPTTEFFEPQIPEDENGENKIKFAPIERPENTNTRFVNNKDPNRFYYSSDDSLFLQEINVSDFKINKIKKYDIWQKAKGNILPTDLQLNGVSDGDIESGAITSYLDPAVPIDKPFSYKTEGIKLEQNIFEFKNDIFAKKANSWRSEDMLSDWVYLDPKFQDKYVYLLDEEYAFKKDKNKGKVFSPVKSEGKTRETLGDIKSIWAPLITISIILIGLI